MAINVTGVFGLTNNAANTTFTFDTGTSVTLQDNMALLFVLTTIGAGTAPHADVTIDGSAWFTLIAENTFGTRRLTVFSISNEAGSWAAHSSLVVTCSNAGSGATATSCAVHCVAVSGALTRGNGKSALLQTVFNTGTGTSGSITLGPTGNTNNRQIAVFAHAATEASTVGSGFTSLETNNYATPAMSILTEWRSASFATANAASWTTSSNWGGYAVELAVQPTGVQSVAVEIAFDSNASIIGPYTDVTPDARTVSIIRGRDNVIDEYQAGTCSAVLKNQDGTYDPNAGPYAGKVVPSLPMRVWCVDSTGARQQMFNGTVNLHAGWSFQYQPNVSTATVSATDGFAPLAAINSAPVGPPSSFQWDGWVQYLISSQTPPPVVAVLNTHFANGTWLQPTIPENTNLLDAIRIIMRSEGGVAYCATDGRLICDHRHAPLTDVRQTAFAAPQFGGAGNTSIKTVGYAQAYTDTIYNRAIVTAINQLPYQVDNTASQTINGVSEADRSGLFFDSSAFAFARANFLVQYFKTPAFVTSDFTVSPNRSAAVMDVAVHRELQDFAVVHFTPPGITARSFNVRIQKIEHEIDFIHQTWDTTFGTTPADPYANLQGVASIAVYGDGVTKYDGTSAYTY